MTPFSARLTFFGFVCLAGAIATNALYFQEPLERDSQITGSVSEGREQQLSARTPQSASEEPAQAAPKGDLQPIAGSKDQERPSLRSAPPQRTPAERAAPPSAGTMPAEEVIRAIQRELAYRNYLVNRRDGNLDTSTRIAILNYQYDNRMILTGRPSESVLKHILFGPFQAAPESGRIARLEADRALVARVQRLLSRLGFGNLPESGRVGADTRDALREFAAFRDLPRDGRLSPRLLLELADVTDKPLAGGGVAVSGDVN
ncbi:peptidoglycan-binding domain-containing protein [Dichotomicrobium thermohalophilum]|uniref:Putative peptidoglycan binding protein n=1 Tax=Dichotomicrobium thermohalophilum TaxID=933063 RepID=A0A397Q1C4_9HYPH|nr:peptidoglycan-binding domain-containing protein [Dichotomicrobium thermohalophilum]RIA55310.1 putative peptidoglycan binding protein [Dichotomicrobium thermohalophilum]